MEDVNKARQVIADEQRAVLDGLRELREEILAERIRYTATHRLLEQRTHELIRRGRGVGVPVTEMAEAWGVTRQTMHAEIRAAEEGDREQRPPKVTRKGGRK